MNKIFLLLVSLFLFGCVESVHKQIDVVHPNEYGLSTDLEGKTFSIYCNGVAGVDSKGVDDKCKEYIAEFAYQQGYNMFSVLDSKGDSNTYSGSNTFYSPVTTYSTASAYSSGYSAFGTGISTSYVPHEESYSFVRFSKTYIFILISEKEKTKYNNYYIVSDYYIPEDTKSE